MCNHNLKINPEEWSKAHIFYDKYLDKRQDLEQELFAQEELKWRNRYSDAPNGSLLSDNVMFDLIKSKDKSYLLHATTKLDQIKSSGNMYSSAGCLVGSVYCTSLRNQGGNLELHNLGKYILDREAKESMKHRKDNAILSTIVIEVEKDKHASRNLIGIDHTRLGMIHYKIYEELKYLLSKKEKLKLENYIVNSIKNSQGFLSCVNKTFVEGSKMSDENFYSSIASTIDNIPYFGYLYFEAMNEHIMLYGETDVYQEYKAKKELFNFDYKNFMFETFESLLKNFNLGKFKPTKSQLTEYFEPILGNATADILQSIKDRVVFTINSRSFETPHIEWSKLNWEYYDLADAGFAPLIGHIIHRELRSFKRFVDFYFYFDQLKALKIWNYWNMMGIQLPFNGVMPKGEIGINPAYPELLYKIYEAKIHKDDKVELGKELKIDIVPRLVDLKNSFMGLGSAGNNIK